MGNGPDSSGCHLIEPVAWRWKRPESKVWSVVNTPLSTGILEMYPDIVQEPLYREVRVERDD